MSMMREALPLVMGFCWPNALPVSFLRSWSCLTVAGSLEKRATVPMMNAWYCDGYSRIMYVLTALNACRKPQLEIGNTRTTRRWVNHCSKGGTGST